VSVYDQLPPPPPSSQGSVPPQPDPHPRGATCDPFRAPTSTTPPPLPSAKQRLKNSALVAAFERKSPSMQLVTVVEFDSSTPRMAMQRWLSRREGGGGNELTSLR
jgi:hypothetical protein